MFNADCFNFETFYELVPGLLPETRGELGLTSGTEKNVAGVQSLSKPVLLSKQVAGYMSTPKDNTSYIQHINCEKSLKPGTAKVFS